MTDTNKEIVATEEPTNTSPTTETTAKAKKPATKKAKVEATAEETPAKKPATKKAPAKKADADTSEAPAKKPATKKAPAKKADADTAEAPAKKPATKKAKAAEPTPAEDVVATAVVAEPVVEAKPAKAKAKATKKANKAKEPLYINGKYVVEKAMPAKLEKGANPYPLTSKQVKITLVKSYYGRLVKQQRTLEALGITKIGHSVIKADNDAIRGMIFVVKHLVAVEDVK